MIGRLTSRSSGRVGRARSASRAVNPGAPLSSRSVSRHAEHPRLFAPSQTSACRVVGGLLRSIGSCRLGRSAADFDCAWPGRPCLEALRTDRAMLLYSVRLASVGIDRLVPLVARAAVSGSNRVRRRCSGTSVHGPALLFSLRPPPDVFLLGSPCRLTLRSSGSDACPWPVSRDDTGAAPLNS